MITVRISVTLDINYVILHMSAGFCLLHKVAI